MPHLCVYLASQRVCKRAWPCRFVCQVYVYTFRTKRHMSQVHSHLIYDIKRPLAPSSNAVWFFTARRCFVVLQWLLHCYACNSWHSWNATMCRSGLGECDCPPPQPDRSATSVLQCLSPSKFHDKFYCTIRKAPFFLCVSPFKCPDEYLLAADSRHGYCKFRDGLLVKMLYEKYYCFSEKNILECSWILLSPFCMNPGRNMHVCSHCISVRSFTHCVISIDALLASSPDSSRCMSLGRHLSVLLFTAIHLMAIL